MKTATTIILSALCVLCAGFFAAGCSDWIPQKQASDEKGPLYLQHVEGDRYLVTHDANAPDGTANRLYNVADPDAVEAGIGNVVQLGSSWLPSPFDKLAVTLGGLASAGAAWYIRKTNKQAKAGEELVLKIEGDPNAKQALKAQAAKHSRDLQEFVKQVTAHT